MRQLLSKLSIRVQVVVPVIIALALLTTGVLISSAKIKEAFNSVSVSTTNTITYKDNLTTVIDNIYSMRISAIYSLFKSSELDVLPKVLKENQEANNQLLDKIAELPDIQDEVDDLKSAMDHYVEYSLNTMLPLLRTKQGSTTLPQSFEQTYAQASDSYRDAGKQMVAAIRALSQRLNELSLNSLHVHEQEHTNTVDYSIVSLIVILLIAIGLGWLVSGFIVEPIKRLQHIMKKVAQGDLTSSIEVKGNNELSALALDVNQTIGQLKSTVDSLNRISVDVASASTELAAVMTQSSANSDQEKNEIEQVSSAIAQLEVTAKSVTENAQEADLAASQANKLVSESIIMFDSSLKATDEMSVQLNSAAQIINSLKEQSDRIGSVIEVIESISEQTNLLALNAAIEAARAGESGRGFAVVADEVRMLASRTQDSTKEIQAIINKLQEQSGSANNSMGLTLSALQENSEVASRVKISLDDILDSIRSLSSVNTQVASSSEEQRQVTEDIGRNISNIYELVSQNVTGITQSAAASHELSNLAEQQNQKLNEFKVV
ncbi:methyl-accepting chemotaxis protein [Vibrio viridaestus]|uniref:Methyl-accepting chemotaxis protein n=1 Tax=Vibrio viridaestus TaxID=2487322 RepID=A0A3N9U9K3_9VIBR|nr:methyl-accepting chemotaxis protein [Vibrio viridaestus]RQW64916.1 methyl-accepting chemotaxis protein [Vibrio viridaestus]